MSSADPAFTLSTHMPCAPRLLAADEVELWALRLDVPDETADALAACLDAQETERAGRFAFPRDRRRFQVAHGALRRLLSPYTGLGADKHQFTYGPHGKPRLADEHPAIHFNLAHADDLAVFAFGRRPIGIDLEAVRPVPEMPAIARALFSPSEYTTLFAMPEEERRDAFLRCWTRKEAYVKAIGDGLSMPLERFTVSMRPGEPAAILAGEGRDAWALYHLAPSHGYLGALAAAGPPHRCVGRLIEATTLRAGCSPSSAAGY